MTGIDIVGYLASALIVASLAMRSVVRLRTVSLIGSIVFVIYGVAIGAIPVIVSNAAIAVINVWYLRRELTPATQMAAVPVAHDEPFLRDFLDANAIEITNSQPDYHPSPRDSFVRLLTRDGLPAGVFMAEPVGNELLVKLDYVTPAFRDSRVAAWLFGAGRSTFTEDGYERLVAHAHTTVHRTYLEMMGFHREGTAYVLDL
ncbi:hypothetical protein [Propioniciclava soli]|uniref:hypothetical protein n=1 Tax=Propioniciclava soli TaxID=2775081 RepID=UPI001E451A11|nr:hypothetical protein [Propioniciclava soli]